MSLISGGLARAAAWALAPVYVRVGLGANAAFRAFKRAGYTMRRTDWLKTYREQSGLERARPYYESVPRKYSPDPAKLAGWDLKDAPRYKAWGRATFMDIETGDLTEKWISMYDDQLRSKDEYTDEFTRQFGDRFVEYNSQLVDITWTDMVQNIRYG